MKNRPCGEFWPIGVDLNRGLAKSSSLLVSERNEKSLSFFIFIAKDNYDETAQ